MQKEKIVGLQVTNLIKSFLDEELTPPEIRLQLAKGLIPLETHDLVSAFYYSLFDSSEDIKAASKASIDALPDRMLHTYLNFPVPEEILHYFANSKRHDEACVELIVLNKGCSAKILRSLAKDASEKIAGMIAENQQKIIEDPGIIDVLEANENVHVSLIERLRGFMATFSPEEGEAEAEKPKDLTIEDMLTQQMEEEEGEEEGKKPEAAVAAAGIEVVEEPFDYAKPMIEVPAEEVLESYSNEEIEDMRLNTYQRIQSMTVAEKIQEALKGTREARGMLIKDANKLVSSAVVKSPKITEDEIVKITSSRSVSDEVLRIICLKESWLRNYRIKLNLVMNPKTPFKVAVKFMYFLRKKDLENIGKSKMVPNIVAAAAKKLASKRRG